ncbi:MAG: hypothetical protein GON13_03005 [Nanoarchaeota archaeon]|nr:hypothetical protein [Nanoarchaeota archaeon]
MKLIASDKQASFAKKPYITKGYYPAKLLKVKEFKDRDGNWKEGTYGRQLIFEFGIYKSDEKGKPTEPMTVEQEGDFKGEKKLVDVILPKFVYHQYKDKKTGEYRTAITPNSAITKIMKALGWEFNPSGVDTDSLIGKFAEVNVNDYKPEGGDKISSINDVGKYEGPAFDASKLRNHETNMTANIKKTVTPPTEPKNASKKEDIIAKKTNLKELKDEGHVTEQSYEQGIEQLDAELAELENL